VNLLKICAKSKINSHNVVPRILWSDHTITQSTTREAPFSLVYKTNVMILVEILECSHKVKNFSTETSNEGRWMNLDLLNEVRDKAWIHSEVLKQRIKKRYKTKLNPQQFKVVDLVLQQAHPY